MLGSIKIEISLADPLGSSVILAATDWVQGTLLGTSATIIAVIAIAAIGLLMLSGRIDVRRGSTVLVGCFVLFGAPVIAKGLREMAGGDGDDYAESDGAMRPPVTIPPSTTAPEPKPNAFDPYAGAAVPR
jgi:type IV secretion system protein VirB2